MEIDLLEIYSISWKYIQTWILNVESKHKSLTLDGDRSLGITRGIYPNIETKNEYSILGKLESYFMEYRLKSKDISTMDIYKALASTKLTIYTSFSEIANSKSQSLGEIANSKSLTLGDREIWNELTRVINL